MNAWQESATYAARDRMQRLVSEADRARLLRAGAPRRARASSGWRHRTAFALRRLADALAPQAEPGGADGVRRGLEPSSGGRLG